MKKLLFILLGVFTFFSCGKEASLETPKPQEVKVTREYSKSFLVSDKVGDNQVYVTVSSDIESNIKDIDAKNFTITPVYEKVQSEANEVDVDSDSSEEWGVNEEYIVIVEYLKVKAGEGVVAHEISLDKDDGDDLSKASWKISYQYWSNGYIGAGIRKTNSKGKTRAKIGVLWSGNSWFYDWKISETLKNTGETATWYTCGGFYKIAVKRKDKRGAKSIYWWYLCDGYCPESDCD